MRDVARAAGVSKPLLYHYFRSKTELFKAALAESAAELEAAIGAKPLAMRGALSDLLTAITKAEQEPEQERIHSVFVSSAYRLFRDPASGDIASFLHTCAEHNVQIVTLDMIYDLTDPAHTALFRSQWELERQYITAQIKRLNAGKRRKRQARGKSEQEKEQ